MHAAIDNEANPSPANKTDLLERLAVLEQMVNEGRRSTERWGWDFILWGIAPTIIERSYGRA